MVISLVNVHRLRSVTINWNLRDSTKCSMLKFYSVEAAKAAALQEKQDSSRNVNVAEQP